VRRPPEAEETETVFSCHTATHPANQITASGQLQLYNAAGNLTCTGRWLLTHLTVRSR
jgi:hypothetical protein